MMLPNVLIIGAQKSGTSWFARLLAQHPDIYFHNREIHFFDKTYNYKKGIEWYKGHFSAAGEKKWIGEKTPDYFWADGHGEEGHSPEVHINIYSHLPDVKLIAILRNPVDRAVSAINHIIKSGRVSPFTKVDQLIYGSKKHLIEKHGVIEKGYYHKQIMAYLDYFNREQLLILIYEEDLVENAYGGLSKICRFLDLDLSESYFTGIEKRINERKESRFYLAVRYYLPFLRAFALKADRYLTGASFRPSPFCRQYLHQLYSDPNKLLYDFMGREIPSWNQ